MSCEAATRPLLVRWGNIPLRHALHTRDRLGRRRAALAVAVALFTRFSFDDTMRRDEAIYAYGGSSSPRAFRSTAGSSTPRRRWRRRWRVRGRARAGARVRDIHAIRMAFFVFACLSVVAVYGWGSCCGARRSRRCWARRSSPPSGRSRSTRSAAPTRRRRACCSRWSRWRCSSSDDGSGARSRARSRSSSGSRSGSTRWSRWRGGRRGVELAGRARRPGGRGAAVRGLRAGCGSRARCRRRWRRRVLSAHGVERVPQTLGGRDLAHRGRGRVRATGTRPLLWRRGCRAVAVVRCGRARGELASLLPLAASRSMTSRGPRRLPVPALRGGRGGGGRARSWPARWRAVVGVAALVAVFVFRSSATRPPAHGTPVCCASARGRAVERLLNPGEHFEAFGDPLSLVLTGTRDPTRFVYLSEGVGRLGRAARVRRLRGLRGRHPGAAARGRGGRRVDRAARPAHQALAGTRYLPDCMGDWLLFLAPGVRERATLRGVPLERPWHLSCPSLGRGVREHPLRVNAGVDRARSP